jgi:gliding motility-associated-like protein
VTDGNFFDTLTVRAVGLPFELTPNAATFSPDTGLVQLNTLFCWAPSCEDVRPEPYLVTFIATSQSCKTNDVVEYPVEIFLTLPPESPLFIEMPSPGVVIEHFVGDDLITILAVARDVNPYDTLTITAASPAFTSPGTPALFAPFTNTGIVASEFTWQPSCPDVSNDLYPLTFTVTSRSCQKDVSESVTIQILVTTPTRGEIAPIPNVFTPNRDGRNDFWNIEDKGDPCLLNFRATVWDRWGREIYTTNNPAFEWSGENSTGNMATDGTYFHVIEYIYSDEKRSYSGNVQILRENNR